jgi:hypothetical protein
MRKISQSGNAASITHFLVKNSLIEADVYNVGPCMSMQS